MQVYNNLEDNFCPAFHTSDEVVFLDIIAIIVIVATIATIALITNIAIIAFHTSDEVSFSSESKVGFVVPWHCYAIGVS